ncbi:hypothetical protein D049_2434, partial [Vibrio parahaemolyticus VPTS-2010]
MGKRHQTKRVCVFLQADRNPQAKRNLSRVQSPSRLGPSRKGP